MLDIPLDRTVVPISGLRSPPTISETSTLSPGWPSTNRWMVPGCVVIPRRISGCDGTPAVAGDARAAQAIAAIASLDATDGQDRQACENRRHGRHVRLATAARPAPAALDADDGLHLRAGSVDRAQPAQVRRHGHLPVAVRPGLRDGLPPRPGEAGVPRLARAAARGRGQRGARARCWGSAPCCCSTAPSTCASASCCCRPSTASACAPTSRPCGRRPTASIDSWPRGRAVRAAARDARHHPRRDHARGLRRRGGERGSSARCAR